MLMLGESGGGFYGQMFLVDCCGLLPEGRASQGSLGKLQEKRGLLLRIVSQRSADCRPKLLWTL